MKRRVQKFSRELLLILATIGVQFPIVSAQAAVILPEAQNGSTVWTGDSLAALDAAQIGAIVGEPGVGLFYDAQFGKAQIATGGGVDGQVVFTAKQNGIAGNDITVQILNSVGANNPLSVSVTGRAITVSLATNAGGAPSSTAAQVASAINASVAAGSLVAASAAGSGAGVVQSLSESALTPVIVETGPFASAYQTAFASSASFPEDASITYGSGGAIDASSLYLYVRGTVSGPAYYIYDLFAPAIDWNGLDGLMLQDFWPGAGSIEQLSIVGVRQTAVPEASSLALLMLGLGVFAWSRVRTRKRA